MLSTDSNRAVDALSAYIAGWYDDIYLFPEVYEFLEKTSHLTVDNYSQDFDMKFKRDYGVIEYNTGTYMGGLKNGSPYGIGKMRFESSTYYGEWISIKNGQGIVFYDQNIVLAGR